MADMTDVLTVRRLIDEPTDVEPWTDTYISTLLDAGATTNEAAAAIWREKAAGFAQLIDVQEGSSVRKMSQLRTNALAMADALGGGTAPETSAPGRQSRMRAIQRV